MAQRIDLPANLRRVRFAPAAKTGTSATDEYTDSGYEQITFATATTYPLGISQTFQGEAYRDLPTRAYDVRGARALSVQLSSYSVTTGATIQLLGSNDSIGYTPLYLLNPATGTLVNSFAIPSGGTATAPNSTLLVIDAPWFQWLQVSITQTDTTGQAFLTILRRT